MLSYASQSITKSTSTCSFVLFWIIRDFLVQTGDQLRENKSTILLLNDSKLFSFNFNNLYFVLSSLSPSACSLVKHVKNYVILWAHFFPILLTFDEILCSDKYERKIVHENMISCDFLSWLFITMFFLLSPLCFIPFSTIFSIHLEKNIHDIKFSFGLDL